MRSHAEYRRIMGTVLTEAQRVGEYVQLALGSSEAHEILGFGVRYGYFAFPRTERDFGGNGWLGAGHSASRPQNEEELGRALAVVACFSGDPMLGTR